MQNSYSVTRTATAVRGALVGKVFGLLAFSFAFTIVGGLVGLSLGPGVAMMSMFGAMGAMIGLNFVREKAPWNLLVMYGFTFLMGMGIGPIVGYYAATAPGIVGNALLMTGGLTGGLGLYAWTTKSDLTRLQNILFPALIGLVVLSLVGLFFQATMFQLLLSLGTVVIFGGFMLVNVQQMRDAQDDSMPTAIMLAVGIYLNIINIFLSILRIMGIWRSND